MRTLICSNKDKNEFCRRILEMDCDNKKFIAEFKLFRKVRSLAQNKLYRLFLNCIKAETGNDTEDLHEYFKEKFIPWESREVFGIELRKHVSTTTMDTKQFTEFLDRIRAFALEQGIYLPTPSDHGFDEFYAHFNK